MDLEEAIGRLNRMITVRSIIKLENLIDGDADIEYIKNADAVEIVLQELEHLQKENEEYSKQLDLDYVDKNFVSKDKIRELIELWKPKLEETDKREEEAKTQEERVVLKCIGIRLDERIKTLQDLLKEE